MMHNRTKMLWLAAACVALAGCNLTQGEAHKAAEHALYGQDGGMFHTDAWTPPPQDAGSPGQDAWSPPPQDAGSPGQDAWTPQDAGAPGQDALPPQDAGSPDGDGGTDGDVCTIEVIDGLAQQCCTIVGPYGPYANCTTYSHEFHDLCMENDITCHSVTASCEGVGYGHAFNMVQLSTGQWCLVEPQAGGGNATIEPCFDDPDDIAPAALCAIMGAELDENGDCPCTVHNNSPTPLPTNTNPVTACALNPAMQGQPPSFPAFAQCENCCVNWRQIYESFTGIDPNELDSWYGNCWHACRNHYHPYYQ